MFDDEPPQTPTSHASCDDASTVNEDQSLPGTPTSETGSHSPSLCYSDEGIFFQYSPELCRSPSPSLCYSDEGSFPPSSPEVNTVNFFDNHLSPSELLDETKGDIENFISQKLCDIQVRVFSVRFFL